MRMVREFLSTSVLAVRAQLTVAAVVLLAACGQIPLESSAPEQFDLSGHWVQTDRPPAGRSDQSRAEDGARPGSGGMTSVFLAQDFPLLVAREMRIEQDARSMGIEYTSGSYRDVTWGDRRRGVWEVRAGWNEGALHIYSSAADVSAAEIWRLSADGERLDIQISVKGNREQEFRRTFRRSSEI
jgi:hypothetical protein